VDTTTESHATHASVLASLGEKLDKMLDKLEEAKPFAKSTYQTDVFQVAEVLVGSDDGMRILYDRCHRFEAAGLFSGGAWDNPAQLQPPLVVGSLKSMGVYPIVEMLSELRMVAIAEARCTHPLVTAEDASQFLQEVMALNLEYIFPADSEEERVSGGPHRDSAVRLFALLADRIGLTFLRGKVVSELEQIAAQRPIVTTRIRRMIEMAERIPHQEEDAATDAQLARFTEAVSAPSPLSREHPGLTQYRQFLFECDPETLTLEAMAFVEALSDTGLVAPHYAVLLRHVVARKPEILTECLELSEAGQAECDTNADFVRQIIKVAVFPGTCQSILGIRNVLELGLLSRQEVRAGLDRLVALDLQPGVRRNLLAYRGRRDGVSANSVLLAGVLAVLGQPLGIGQGRNPTCQAARGISLWARCSPALLLQLIISAARDGIVESPFEGHTIKSDHGAAQNRGLDLNLDPVSIVLVPHLDRIYEEMMKLVALRGEDGHKWVNPAFYGRWVPTGFASVFADASMTTITDFPDFVRRFFATHHPAFNDGHILMYPNPVGICVTNGHGDYLGPHAVSIQRVAEGPNTGLRVYFFNPNNEGRQDWGFDVRPTVKGNGEFEGESSLPFDHFASRLYAFHYNPYEEGDAYAVPDEQVQAIEAASRESWGRAFTWLW